MGSQFRYCAPLVVVCRSMNALISGLVAAVVVAVRREMRGLRCLGVRQLRRVESRPIGTGDAM
jgi:hypothetical protein